MSSWNVIVKVGSVICLGQALGESLYKHIVKHIVEMSLFSSSDVTQSADSRRNFRLDWP